VQPPQPPNPAGPAGLPPHMPGVPGFHAAGPPPGPGQGRKMPAPGFPLSPRLFSQKSPNTTQQARVDSRRVH
jgi:hypothetical protein